MNLEVFTWEVSFSFRPTAGGSPDQCFVILPRFFKTTLKFEIEIIFLKPPRDSNLGFLYATLRFCLANGFNFLLIFFVS